MESAPEESLLPAAEDIAVVHIDEALVVANKPAGLLVHRTPQARDRVTLRERLVERFGEVHPVHRIDRPTSGLVVYARTREAASALGAVLRESGARKLYLALVRGWVHEPAELDYAVRPARGGERREAVTRYAPLGHAEQPWAVGPYATARYSWLCAEPRTGRWHQLRQHFHHLNHHLIGDTKHGDPLHNRAFGERTGLARMALHAYRLRLPHPLTGEPLDLVAPLADDLAAVCARFGWPLSATFADLPFGD